MAFVKLFKTTPSHLFQQHRIRVQNIKCKVDAGVPTVNIEQYASLQKQVDDFRRYSAICKENRTTMKDIVRLLRVGGAISNTLEDAPRTFYKSTRLDNMKIRIKQLEMENRLFAQRLQNVKPQLDTGTRRRPNLKEQRKLSEERFKIPFEILNKYKDSVSLTMEKKTLHILLRPKVYFDLTLMTANRFHNTVAKTLGRVVMQLYTEACPQVVLEFVRTFKRGIARDLSVLRLFPTLWLEAELSLKNSPSSLKKPKIEYDMRAIDHGKSAGILSFARSNLSGFPYGVLNFSISFRPLSVLNRKRIGFGKVIEGQKIIDWVQIFGTKNGKPTREIKITNCGILR